MKTKWDVVGVMLTLGFVAAVITQKVLLDPTTLIAIGILGLAVIAWAAITVIKQQRKYSQRAESTRREANRLIDEYEAVYGRGSSGWVKFK